MGSRKAVYGRRLQVRYGQPRWASAGPRGGVAKARLFCSSSSSPPSHGKRRRLNRPIPLPHSSAPAAPRFRSPSTVPHRIMTIARAKELGPCPFRSRASVESPLLFSLRQKKFVASRMLRGLRETTSPSLALLCLFLLPPCGFREGGPRSLSGTEGEARAGAGTASTAAGECMRPRKRSQREPREQAMHVADKREQLSTANFFSLQFNQFNKHTHTRTLRTPSPTPTAPCPRPSGTRSVTCPREG